MCIVLILVYRYLTHNDAVSNLCLWQTRVISFKVKTTFIKEISLKFRHAEFISASHNKKKLVRC